MRRHMALIVAAVLAAGAGSAQNLLVDPGLEARNTAAWALRDAAFTGENPLVGDVACAVVPGVKNAGIWQTASVTEGSDYVALGWIKMAVWGERGWFCVVQADGDTVKQAVTHKGWMLYAIPFTAGRGQATVGWMMDENTGGSWCDMFALSAFENFLADPGVEDGGLDVTDFGGWVWGAWATADGPRTGDMAWLSDAAGGGGWGFYPPFEEGDIILSGAWLKTGAHDSYVPGLIDRGTGSNLGWWAVRKKEHECEINLIYSDTSYYQYVIPYKIPANATSPEIMWWQSWGQNPGFCDDMFLIKSPYTNDQVPWDLFRSDPDSNWGFWENPDDPYWPVTPDVGVESKGGALPGSFSLEQNHPNPFNPSTEISYTLDRPQAIQLAVFSLSGREVAVLAEGRQSAGGHRVRFDASGLASGVYLYRLQSGDAVSTRKMLLVR